MYQFADCNHKSVYGVQSAYIYLAKGWFHVKPLSHSGQAGPFRALLVILGHLGHPVGQWYAPQGVLGRRLHSASETLVQEKPYADGCGTVVL